MKYPRLLRSTFVLCASMVLSGAAFASLPTYHCAVGSDGCYTTVIGSGSGNTNDREVIINNIQPISTVFCYVSAVHSLDLDKLSIINFNSATVQYQVINDHGPLAMEFRAFGSGSLSFDIHSARADTPSDPTSNNIRIICYQRN